MQDAIRSLRYLSDDRAKTRDEKGMALVTVMIFIFVISALAGLMIIRLASEKKVHGRHG